MGNSSFELTPVVGLDIDGTMGDYHGHFLRFAAQWYGRPMPDPSENTDGVPLYRWMGTSKSTYRQCKLAYRQGGLKRSMPCDPAASELSRELRRRGWQAWTCTTRPFLRLDNIDPDTRHWLRRNKIQHDGVLWGENKYRDLVKIVGVERVKFMVDDLPPLIDQAHSLGLPTVIRSRPYNLNYDEPGERVSNLRELLRSLP